MKMRRLFKLAESMLAGRVTLLDKPLAEPEPAFAHTQPVRGLFALLTPEQRAKALAHQGDDRVGDPKAFLAKA
jgi:hypothetical protein